MSNIEKIHSLVTAIYTQIGLTHLECSGDSEIADHFVISMSFETFARVQRLPNSDHYLYRNTSAGKAISYTLAGYSVELHDNFEQAPAILLKYQVWPIVDLSKVIPSASEIAKKINQHCSRGVEFEW